MSVADQVVTNRVTEALEVEDFEEVVRLSSKAVEQHTDNLVTALSNRALAQTKLQKHLAALTDADSAIKLNPLYAKAYLWKGAAFIGLECYDDAKSTLQKGASLQEVSEDDASSFKKMILECDQKLAGSKQELTVKDSGLPWTSVDGNKLLPWLLWPDVSTPSLHHHVPQPQPQPQLFIATDFYVLSCKFREGQDICKSLGKLGSTISGYISVIGGSGQVRKANLGGRVHDGLHNVAYVQGIVTESGTVGVNMCITSIDREVQPKDRVVHGGLVREGTVVGKGGVVLTLYICYEFREA